MRQQRLSEVEEHDHGLDWVGDERVEEVSPLRRRLPAVLLTALVMMVFAGGLWFAYVQGTKRAAVAGPGGVPLLRADDKPTKVKPDQPGGMSVPDQNMSVYNEKPAPQVEKLLPAPEQPLPRPAPSKEPPPAAAAAPPSPSGNPTPPTSETAAGAAPATAPPGAAKPAPATAAAKKPEPNKPAAPSAAALEAKALLQPASTGPAASAAARSGPVRLQLASLRTPEAAREEWARLKREHPELLGNLTAVAVRADLGDRGVYYRIQTQAFADAASADKVCAELRRQKLGCALVR